MSYTDDQVTAPAGLSARSPASLARTATDTRTSTPPSGRSPAKRGAPRVNLQFAARTTFLYPALLSTPS